MNKTLAMVFAGGRGAEYSVLTDRRPKAAVIFCGLYRTIDFALTNLSAAGIRTVGVLAQYRHSSLMDHVGSGIAWDLLGTDRGVRFLPPYLATEAGSFYRGPAEALYQNIDFIERNQADDVLVVSGDQVYSMDYEPLLQFHRERDADLTMALKPIDDRPSRFGIGEINATGQLLRFTEKPALPRTNLASIGIYVFKQRVLVDELRRAVRGERDATSQIHEILHRMIPRRRAYGWTFRGPWFYVETLDAYVELHRRLVGAPAELLPPWLPVAAAVGGSLLSLLVPRRGAGDCFATSELRDDLWLAASASGLAVVLAGVSFVLYDTSDRGFFSAAALVCLVLLLVPALTAAGSFARATTDHDRCQRLATIVGIVTALTCVPLYVFFAPANSAATNLVLLNCGVAFVLPVCEAAREFGHPREKHLPGRMRRSFGLRRQRAALWIGAACLAAVPLWAVAANVVGPSAGSAGSESRPR